MTVINMADFKKKKSEPKEEIDFESIMKKNEENKKRLESDRLKDNRSVFNRYNIETKDKK